MESELLYQPSITHLTTSESPYRANMGLHLRKAKKEEKKNDYLNFHRTLLFQFRVYCDLSVVGNVQRVQVGNEKWLKLMCRHALAVSVLLCCCKPFHRVINVIAI